jgi:hypothetical protein
MDNGHEMRDFLVSRRAKITPEQAGLPTYGTRRPAAPEFYPDWERQAQDMVALLPGGPGTTSASTAPASSASTTPPSATPP